MLKTRKEIAKKYCQSEKGKKKKREYMRKWAKTDKGKASIEKTRSKYTESERYKKYLSSSSEGRKRYNRSRHLKHRYGITIDEYESMLKEQGHRCKICDKTSSECIYGKLYIDHCHATGKVRGLLCNKCNSAIGLLGDSRDILKKALDYLSSFRSL